MTLIGDVEIEPEVDLLVGERAKHACARRPGGAHPGSDEGDLAEVGDLVDLDRANRLLRPVRARAGSPGRRPVGTEKESSADS